MTLCIGRRAFITLLSGGAAAAWPVAARAQQSDRVRRIGFLRAAPPPERELDAFLRGLADRGWVQGRNFLLVPQWGDGNVARLPELAVALVNAGVDVILAEGVVTTRAARAVTATIPIVMTGGADPFVGGLVQSLARPGGNLTGFSTMAADIAGKRLEIFRDTVPGLVRVAVLVPRAARNLFAAAQDQAAKALGIDLVYIDLPGPEAAGTVMRQAVSGGVQGALLLVGPFTSSSQRQMIVDLAAEFRLPVMYERREYIQQGGLVTYGPDAADLYRRAAGYVTTILAGAYPGDLPIEQPTKFELAINLKTAKALGLQIPDKLLALADEVIE
jgi:putative ABC transport system substrate-binding protein